MIRRIFLVGLVSVALAGCAEKPSEPALQEGDRVRLRLGFVPTPPWRAGAKVTIILQAEVHRPGRDMPVLLGECDVPAEGLVLQGRVTFFVGQSQLGEARKVSLVRDC